MNPVIQSAVPDFLNILGIMEEPMGMCFTDIKPAEGFSPKPMDLPTREKEKKNESTILRFNDFKI